MSRRSNFTDEQWADIGRRMLEGESARALAREFDTSESTIRSRFARKGARSKTVQQVAGMIVEAGNALDALPPDAQVSVINLAAKLRSISESLACAAELGAKTAHRLHALANSQVDKVDDAEPMSSQEALKGVAVLTKMANDAASTPLNLLAANKDAAKKLVEDPPPGEDDVLTPERRINGVRRIAFLLQKTASEEKH